jgi:hypothetical protein
MPRDVAKNGIKGHIGSNGSNLQKRLESYCSLRHHTRIGEAVLLGPDCDNAREIVMDMLIDDGVRKREHRYVQYCSA